MLSMCLLFCFVIFWILCCVMCEKKKNDDNKKKKVLNITVQGRLHNHLLAGRSHFIISGARANIANPVRVLTKVNFYFGKYKQRDYFSRPTSSRARKHAI